MPTIRQRIASAFVVLCGRCGDVTRMAQERDQSRQSLYREATQVVQAVDGTAIQSHINGLERQLSIRSLPMTMIMDRRSGGW